VLVFCSADYEIGTLKLVNPIRPGAKLTVISEDLKTAEQLYNAFSSGRLVIGRERDLARNAGGGIG
jgi:hypothetical protein